MLKLKEEFKHEKLWHRKVKILETYHLATGNEIRDTADDLGVSVGYVSEALTLARELEKNPDLSKLSRNAAIKLVRKK